MLTQQELLRAVLAPLLTAAAIAAAGAWRGWRWAMPAAAGAGFLLGYALLGLPRLPPRDGTDWLFWLAVPATLLGVADAVFRPGWGWALGAAAGLVALVIVRPLVPGAVPVTTLVWTSTAMAVAGALLALVAHFAEDRAGTTPVVAALSLVVGAAAVVVFSSNLRIVGIYGVAASAALAPVAVLAHKSRAGRSVALVALALLAGLLAGGRFYPEPGVTWTNLIVLMAAPLLLLLGAVLPPQPRWLRGASAVAAVAIATAAVAAPTALKAKEEAEKAVSEDPYSQYYR